MDRRTHAVVHVVVGGYGLMHLGLSTRVLGADVDFGVRDAFNRAYPEVIAGHLVAPGQPRAVSFGVRRGF